MDACVDPGTLSSMSATSLTRTRDLPRRTLACLGAHLALTRFRISIDMFLPQTDQSQSVAIGEDRERASERCLVPMASRCGRGAGRSSRRRSATLAADTRR